MDCQFAIVHELIKEKNSDRATIRERETLLDLNDDKVITTVTSALTTIGTEGNRIMRGIFLNNGRQGNFPKNSVIFFDNLPDDIQRADQVLGEKFIDLTKIALDEIKNEIVQPASTKMSTGGYLLFSLHKANGNQFFSCMMIKKNTGVAFDENLNITSSMYIDLKKLIQSFTLNLTRHAQIRLMTEEERIEAESHHSDDLTYLKFIGHNKNKDPGADYFINAFGCERGSKSNIVTRGVIKAIDEFCNNKDIKPFKLKIKDAITEYLSRIPHNQHASLEGIKNVLNTQIQSLPDLPENFDQNQIVDEFIDKLHKDKDEGGYGVPSEFSVDQMIVKKNSRIKISDTNDDWMINFRLGLIGESEDATIYFNKSEKSIKFNNLNDSVVAALTKAIDQ